MNDFETAPLGACKTPLTNSELERGAFRKLMVSKYSWPDDDEFWEVDAKGKFIDDEFEDTFALFCDARAALCTEAQPEVTGAVRWSVTDKPTGIELLITYNKDLAIKHGQDNPNNLITPLYPPSAIEGYAQELAKRLVREKLDANLIQRCKEVRSWQKTGVLKENSKLQEYADKYYSGLENNLLNAEADTGAQAMQLLIDLSAP